MTILYHTPPTPAASSDAACREPLVFRRGGDLVLLALGVAFAGLGFVFLVLGLGALIHGFEGPAGVPVVFAVAGLAAVALGAQFLFGRKTIVIDPGRRLVVRTSRFLGKERTWTTPFDAYHAVGIGVAHASGGESDTAYYVVELRGEIDLALPWSSGDHAQACANGAELATMMGLPFDADPRGSLGGFVRWASGRWER